MAPGVRLTRPATLDSVPELIGFVLDQAQACGLPPGRLPGLELAAEEALVNVASYAYGQGAGQMSVECLGQEGVFRLEIEDQGAPFDPTQNRPPDLSLGVEERGVGGLGVFFMKKFMDRVAYRRDGASNVLTLEASLTAAPEEQAKP